ncbi:choice-of-anchor Q domain-containing protein [Spirosoma pulveris]
MKKTCTWDQTVTFSALPGFLLGVCLCLLSTLPVGAQTVYVTPLGAGGQTGVDWANALAENALQVQLAMAPQGTVFRLAGGLYKPSMTRDRNISFLIPSGVQVYGGYQGSGPTPDQRMDFGNLDQPSSTTLSGDVDQDNQLDEDNTDHVVVFTHAVEQTRLDGVVITGGYASQTNPPPYYPGGPTYSDPGGAGIYNNTFGGDSSPTIENCWLIGNRTLGNGGALLTDLQGGSTQLKLINTHFIDNIASSGGAIYTLIVNGHSLNSRLTNCRFLANSAQRGGAVFTEFSAESRGVGSVTPTYVNCSFEGNQASDRGGAFYTTAFSSASLRVQSNLINCTLMDNLAPRGGAFYNTGGPSMARTVQLYVGASLTNSIVWNNGGATAVVNEDYRQPPGVTSFERGFVNSTNGLLEADLLLTSGTANQLATLLPFSGPSSLQLAPCSPAIDAGLTSAYTQANGPATDLAGHVRIFPLDGPIDIGAAESQHPASQLLIITQQPASQSSVVAGSTVETTVGLNSVADSYTWYKDGGLVPGQTSATLRLTNVQPQQAGSYSLVATSACNSVTSTAFSLSVTTPTTPSAGVTHFWLINADTDQPIQELTAGTQLNLSTLPTRNLNIQAVTEPATVGSVAFSLSGQQRYQVVEGVAPYALFGDNQGDYLTWTPNLGSYSLTATPYAGASGTGAIGTALTVDFTVVSQPGSQQLTHFWLINADTDQPIRELADGQEVDLSSLPTRNLNIQAVTEPATVGSVVFELSGRQTRRQVETVAPYALFTDNQGDYVNWTPELGTYTLVATPYSGAGGTETAGVPRRVSFVVTNPGAARLAAGREEPSVAGSWQVRVLGNPVTGNEVVVEVIGAQGQSLHYELLDGSGRSVESLPIQQASSLERQTMHIGSQGLGLLLLRVSTPTHSQTVKVLKQ